MSLEDNLFEQRLHRAREIEALGFRPFGQRFDFVGADPVHEPIEVLPERRTSLAITPKGEALLRETIRNRIAWLARVMESRLTPDERNTLRAAALLMERIARQS